VFGDRRAESAGALLVAERLKRILRLALEGLIEFVRLHPESFLGGVFARADGRSCAGEEILADPSCRILASMNSKHA